MAGKQGRKKARRTVSGPKKPTAAKPATVLSCKFTCKYHMSEESVQAILNHKRAPFPLGSYFKNMSPEDQRFMLDVAAHHEQVEDRYAKYQERVRKEMDEKGFVALPDDFDERTAAVNAASSEVFRGVAEVK